MSEQLQTEMTPNALMNRADWLKSLETAETLKIVMTNAEYEKLTNNMGEWLQRKLDESGLNTLSNLALKSGISKGTLSKYFRGLQRPSIDVIRPLSDALNISPTELLIGLGAIDNDERSRH